MCQAIDMVLSPPTPDSGIHLDGRPSTPPSHTKSPVSASTATQDSSSRTGSRPFRKAFCAIRPPGHHCGEDAPSGYVHSVKRNQMMLTEFQILLCK